MVVEVVEVVVLVVDTDVELTVFSVTGRIVEVAGAPWAQSICNRCD